MRVLITWDSKHAGVEEEAHLIGKTLRDEGYETEVMDATAAAHAVDFDAAVIGGTMSPEGWRRGVRHLIDLREEDLREVPVWFFSSVVEGEDAGAPPKRALALMNRVGGQQHVVFHGQHAEPTDHAAEPREVGAWAHALAKQLPVAKPKGVVPHPWRALVVLGLFGAAAWAVTAVARELLLTTGEGPMAAGVFDIVSAAVYFVSAIIYFNLPHAQEPLPTAVIFAGELLVLDAIVFAGLLGRGTEVLLSAPGLWIPFTAAFVITWVTGALSGLLSFPRPPRTVT